MARRLGSAMMANVDSIPRIYRNTYINVKTRNAAQSLPMKPKLDIHIRPTSSLSRLELEEIWALTDRYIDTSQPYFERKLLELPEIGLWRVRGGELAGLVSLDVYPADREGRTATIIFTSSVVTDERFRGRNLVLKTGLRLLVREKLRRPQATAYWFFDTFSYKSYLLAVRNLGDFWPRRDRPTPPGTAAFMDQLAQARYGEDWIADAGVVRRSGQKRLRSTTAPIEEKLLSDRDVQFFESVNPGHRDGDMLVCLAPLTLRNLLGAIGRARLAR